MNLKLIAARFALMLGLFINGFGSSPFASTASQTQLKRNVPAFDLYDPGSPSYTDLWVDPLNGNDANPGTLAFPFRTLTHAWESVPATNPLTQAIRINLQPGTYTSDIIPNYWETRYGTYAAPILIRGNGTTRDQVILQNTVSMYDVHYVYFENLSIQLGGDVFHCELCSHILLRNMVFNGDAQLAQEAIKVNQSQYMYIENNDISGAWDNAIDFVSVQYGHIVQNQIHNAGDWCAYTKGGSAYLTIESNTIYDCGTGGYTAGQGTGFQFMSPPWIQYEAYDIKVMNNIIHDTDGAGLGVNGGYNILMAYNTLYRVGSRDHVIEAVFGSRSCDGVPGNEGRERCQQYLDQGGWGTTVVDNGDNHIRIPNKNVFIYNNVIYNPTGYSSQWQQFAVYEPHANPPESNAPSPARTDDNLQIRGNVIWNGAASLPLGIEGTLACQASNPTCNETQLKADNAINTIQPQFIDPAAGNFHPTGAWMKNVTAYPIPDFTWTIAIPAGNTSNAVASDFENATRLETNPPGAYYINAPVVTSILRADPNPTNAASVNFTVTFSSLVTGVDANDFELTSSGVSGAAVSGLSGAGSTYTVTVNTGSGDGSIRLDVVDDNSISDASGIPLGGLTALDGNFTAGGTYTVNKSSTFADVPLTYWANGFIERLYNASITGGCSAIPLNYCPTNSVTRAQMAIFLVRAKHGVAFVPPTATGIFSDVPVGSFGANYIEQLANDGITSGCGGGKYCPTAIVNRAQMAVFLVRAEHGVAFVPSAATGVFADVPVGSFGANYIEQLVTDGITSGCGGGNYCPNATVKRDSMAVFLVRTFGLP